MLLNQGWDFILLNRDMRRSIREILMVAVAAVAVACGCNGDGKEDGPEAVVTAFSRAMAEGDWDEAVQLCDTVSMKGYISAYQDAWNYLQKQDSSVLAIASSILSKADFKVEKTENGVTITFTHADGLHFDGDISDLNVYDTDGNAIPYTAAVEGDALNITADGLARIELGWRNACTHNLYNSADYLASPFQIIL